MDKKRILGNLMLLLTALIWGFSFVFQRVGMDHIEPLTFGSARSVLAALALLVLVVLTDRQKKRKGLPETRSAPEAEAYRKNTLRGGVVCGIFLTLAASFQQMGIVYTTAGKTGFITALYIVFVPVIGWIFLKKNITWLVWIGVVLATAGMYFLSITDTFALTKGDTLIFICAIFFALHILSCDHFVQIADPLKMSMIQFVVAAVLGGAAAFVFETPTAGKLMAAAVPILYAGILSGGVAYTLQMFAQKFTEPTVASLILSLEAVFGVLGGWLILKEVMTPREVLGSAVVFAAIILVQIPLPEKKKG